jgi:hypothetical protein
MSIVLLYIRVELFAASITCGAKLQMVLSRFLTLSFLFFFLLLSHLDELEVTLVLESEEHADSILRFELVCGKVCI